MNGKERSYCEEYGREQWGPIVTRLNAENNFLKEKVKRYEIEVGGGMDARVLVKAINENEATAALWKQIMMLLRLSN